MEVTSHEKNTRIPFQHLIEKRTLFIQRKPVYLLTMWFIPHNQNHKYPNIITEFSTSARIFLYKKKLYIFLYIPSKSKCEPKKIEMKRKENDKEKFLYRAVVSSLVVVGCYVELNSGDFQNNWLFIGFRNYISLVIFFGMIFAYRLDWKTTNSEPLSFLQWYWWNVKKAVNIKQTGSFHSN